MLLERDHILEELARLAVAAAEGQGRVALIIGEAGIGKTTVLRALGEKSKEALRIFWTACEDIASPEAMTILRELPQVVRNVEEARDSASRLSLFQQTLLALAETPTLLFVEDLHWADDGTIDFLRYAGRRIEGLPC